MADDECFVCGKCWWEQCDNDADYEVDVELQQVSNRMTAYNGKVDLCGGHYHLASQTGRMNIKWEAIHQAIARDAA